MPRGRELIRPEGHVSFALTLLSAALLTTGCGADANTERPTETIGQAITDGAPAPDDTSVVALVYELGEARPVMCTGVIVAPRVVLTAAHCVAPRVPEAVVVDTRDGRSEIAVARAVAHPEYRGGASADIAAIVLAEPAGAPTASIGSATDATTGELVRVVGFGLARDGSPRGRRSGTAKIVRADASELVLDAAPSRPCLGDSGGPVLVGRAGMEHVVALTSRGDDACASYARATRLDAESAFIDSVVAETEPTSATGCSMSPAAPVAPRSLPSSTMLVLVLAVVALSLRARASSRLFPFAAALLGCAGASTPDDASPRIDRVSSAVVGGWEVWNPAAVALVSTAGVVCSGVLIGPHAVLTAAHCRTKIPGAVVFGNDPIGAPESSVVIPLSDFVASPDFDPKTLANDLAIAVLRDPAPSWIPAAKIRRSSTLDEDGVHFVGFGKKAADDVAFTKREGWAAIVSSTVASFATAPAPSQPCLGDGGGPAYGRGEGYADREIVGVISFGDKDCASGATFTRVDGHAASFIDPLVVATSPRSARVGQLCRHPSACVEGATCLSPATAPLQAYCTRSCEAPSDCPAAMRCEEVEGGARTCVHERPPGTRGAACLVDADCTSRVCAALGASAECARSCEPGSRPCDAGYTCEPDASHDGRFACYRASEGAPASLADDLARTHVVTNEPTTSAAGPAPLDDAHEPRGCAAAGSRGRDGSAPVPSALAVVSLVTLLAARRRSTRASRRRRGGRSPSGSGRALRRRESRASSAQPAHARSARMARLSDGARPARADRPPPSRSPRRARRRSFRRASLGSRPRRRTPSASRTRGRTRSRCRLRRSRTRSGSSRTAPPRRPACCPSCPRALRSPCC